MNWTQKLNDILDRDRSRTHPEETAERLRVLLKQLESSNEEESVRAKESSLLKLCEIYRETKNSKELSDLLISMRPILVQLPKAKTSKLVRNLIDSLSEIPDTLSLRIQLCQESIKWCEQEKRSYLRQSLETRLIALYFENKQYTEALGCISTLLGELKRLDDKMLLMEVQLLESKVHHVLRSLPKARAALTSARTSANSIYCPPLLQASLDMQSGILHAEEHDYKTAYSYFCETFECYSSQEDNRALSALKYMLLCKVMLHQPEDVNIITSGKIVLKYASRDIDAMKAIATAHLNRSLHEFETALRDYSQELQVDTVVSSHLNELYDTLLEQHLSRLIEPYSVVEISHIATMIHLGVDILERKLSQMILDKKLMGVLDQGNGLLIVYEDQPADPLYEYSLETIQNLHSVVESLYHRTAYLK